MYIAEGWKRPFRTRQHCGLFDAAAGMYDSDVSVSRSLQSGILSSAPMASALLVVCFFTFNDLLHWFVNGGGFPSVVNAVYAVGTNARFVDVDSSGLIIVFVALFALISAIVGSITKSDLSEQWVQFALMLWVYAGGFAADTVCGEKLINRYMAQHRYERCIVRDRVAGSGKGRVYFDDFVSNSRDCATGSQSR